jgi:hypothetical protein
MSFQALFLMELAVVYFVGSITGPPLARLVRRLWRRLRGRKASEWDGYFKN